MKSAEGRRRSGVVVTTVRDNKMGTAQDIETTGDIKARQHLCKSRGGCRKIGQFPSFEDRNRPEGLWWRADRSYRISGLVQDSDGVHHRCHDEDRFARHSYELGREGPPVRPLDQAKRGPVGAPGYTTAGEAMNEQRPSQPDDSDHYPPVGPCERRDLARTRRCGGACPAHSRSYRAVARSSGRQVRPCAGRQPRLSRMASPPGCGFAGTRTDHRRTARMPRLDGRLRGSSVSAEATCLR